AVAKFHAGWRKAALLESIAELALVKLRPRSRPYIGQSSARTMDGATSRAMVDTIELRSRNLGVASFLPGEMLATGGWQWRVACIATDGVPPVEVLRQGFFRPRGRASHGSGEAAIWTGR